MAEAEQDGVQALAEYFLSGAGEIAGAGPDHDHGDPSEGSTSVREFDHHGHHVAIETTYRITIDGQPLHGHVEVLPSGQVHYHRFPQYAPRSAVDVVKTIIDTVWDRPAVPDELADDTPEPPPDHDHGPHDHHEHGGHQ